MRHEIDGMSHSTKPRRKAWVLVAPAS